MAIAASSSQSSRVNTPPVGLAGLLTMSARVRGVTSELLVGYLDAVCDRSIAWIATLSDADLDRIVDTRFTPPVTLAVRLVSVISDDLQHAGQAAFIRGVLERQR